MWDWLSKVTELKKMGEVFALVTITNCKGSSPRNSGAKIIIKPSGEFYGTIGGGRLEELVIEDSLKCLSEAISDSHKYGLCVRGNQCCGGTVDTFVEVFGLEPRLYLFGAGHVGQSVVNTLEGTPFVVHLVDDRPEWIDHENLSPFVVKHQKGWKTFIDEALWDRNLTYVAIMTHDHQLDLELVSAVIDKQAKYIGLIGSQTKWKKFQMELQKKDYNEDQIHRIKCPIGLPIGGKAPKEVAISVAGELLQRFHHG